MSEILNVSKMQGNDSIIKAIFDEDEIAKWDNREYGADEEYAELAD